MTLILYIIYFSVLQYDSIQISTQKFESPKKETKVVQQDSTINKTIIKHNLELIDSVNPLKTSNKPINTLMNDSTKNEIIYVKVKSSSDILNYIIPIFTLILGILINQVLDFFSNKKRINKIGNRWVEEFRSLEFPIEKQKESISSFVNEIEKGEFRIPKLQVYADIDGEKFKAIDKNEFINFLENKLSKLDFKELVKISNKFHGNLSILSSLHVMLKERFNKFLNESSKETSSFNAHFQELLKAFNDYQVYLEKEIKIPVIEDPRFKTIGILFMTHIAPNIEDGKLDVFKLEDLFFKQLIIELTPFRLDEKANKLSRTTTLCLNNIKSLRLEIEYIVENLDSISLQYDTLNNNLKDLITKIDKH